MDHRAADAPDPAVYLDCDLDVPVLVAFLVGGNEVLATVLGPFDRPTHEARDQGDQGLLDIVDRLRPETAADVGRNHT